MRTVSTLCATGAAIGTSALGLTLATTDDQRSHNRPTLSRSTTSGRDMSLTATAIFTFSAANSSPSSLPSYTFATPEQPRRSAAAGSAPPHYHNTRLFRSISEDAHRALRKSEGQSRASLSVADSVLADPDDVSPQARHPPRRTWLRRLSMSSSRESSRPPTSRPASAAVSHSNGSIAYSNAGSATPIFSSPPQPLPPNKLVKRSSSIHSTKDSPGTSKLPLPTFRRPATSHQRSSMQLERHAALAGLDHTTSEAYSDSSRDPHWRLYFTSKVAQDDLTSRRRRSSSIPNPIKRIYPDRKYRPSLISGRERIAQGEVEYDNGFSSAGSSMIDVAADYESGVTSSPLLATQPEFEQAQPARRSFSIGDLLSTGPSWRSTSTSRPRTTRRKPRRVSSASNSDMGSMLDVNNDYERPTKRRELTSSEGLSRGLYNSSSAIAAENGSATPQDNAEPNSIDVFSSQSRSSSAEQRRIPSSTYSTQSTRPTRLSATTSEVTSGADSDSEYRSLETNTDYQSDAIFDSLPTRATRSSSSRRGPPIDTIFDETPPSFSSGRSTKLKDFLTQDSFVIMDNSHRYSTIEEEESVSTPVRSVRDKSITSSPAARTGSRSIFSSSPPTLRHIADPDDIDWDAPDELDGPDNTETNTPQHRNLPLRFAPVARALQFPVTLTPQRNSYANTDRATIFDWSEAQPSPSHNASPPRPKTVHGKKDADNRGSRPIARRPVSGMHARSHSVPVVPDVDSKRSNASNKFGTWGVGSKAVTEDWNEDFDFAESPTSPAESSSAAERRVDSGRDILVPPSIREQASRVQNNIHLLRDWGLLIEELKELRLRAVRLDMLSMDPYALAWKEVDAMIELADQETNEHTLEARRSPPSSPGFDYSAFEEEPVPDMTLGAERAQPLYTSTPSVPQTPLPTINVDNTGSTAIGRPRKDSEAVARSVIEALRTRRSVSDPSSLQPVPQSKKVPFDTAILRHIVPYVHGLLSRVKEDIRLVEGLYKSPSATRHARSYSEDGDDDNDDYGEEIDQGAAA